MGIHFSLELYSGLDIYCNETEIRILPDIIKTAGNIWEELHVVDSIGKSARIRGMILSLAGCFIRNSRGEISELIRIRNRYSVILDWIRENIKAGISVSDLAGIGKGSFRQTSFFK